MSELRAGGLALIVVGDPEVIGLVVTTERLIIPGGLVELPCGTLIRNASSMFRWLVHDDRLCIELSDSTFMEDYCLFHLHHLMPIDGEDFSHEDERQKELTNG